VAGCLIAGCASVGTPGGGPEDKTPPEAVSSNPATGSVSLPPRTPIEVFFSEPVDPASLEASIFVSPTGSARPKVKVHGNRAVITLADSLPKVGALVLTIGSGVKDLHGNPLKSSLTLAFSAGSTIAGGAISGQVHADAGVQGMLVGAWPSSDSVALRPDTMVAPFLTQSDLTGRFKLEYLPAGRYRIAAWDDRDGDRKYRSGVDRLALPSQDLDVMIDSTALLDMTASVRDTTVAIPALVSAPDRRHLVLRLTKPVRGRFATYTQGLAPNDSMGGTLGIWAAWIDPADSTRIDLLTAVQDSGVWYHLDFPADSASLKVAAGVPEDTLGPRIVASAPKEQSKVLPEGVGGWLAFDDALDTLVAPDAVKLTARDSSIVPVLITWPAPNRVEWRAAIILKPGITYVLTVNLARFRDRCGNRGADTVETTAFSTLDPSTLGSIAGIVSRLPSWTVYVQARGIDAQKKLALPSTVLPDGSYKVQGLDPGRYLVWCWADRVADGAFTSGNLTPFQFCDPFAWCPDTVTVRARWETSGKDIRLP